MGFRDPGWSIAVVLGYAASIWLLTQVVERMQVSITYAVWAGLGTVGIAAVGFLFLGEDLGLVKVFAIALIVSGVVVLNLAGSHRHVSGTGPPVERRTTSRWARHPAARGAFPHDLWRGEGPVATMGA